MPSRPAAAFTFGKSLTVDTSVDEDNHTDGKCSLREAINATNINGGGDASSNTCNAIGSGGTDGISFSLGAGTPVINITSDLPHIAGPLFISGAGPATRVELRGPGDASVFDGLTIDAGGANSSIDHLVIDNFEGTDIKVVASGVTLTGNFIGTNASGTATPLSDTAGVDVEGGNATIGGGNGTTPGGACTGDCNLISPGGDCGVVVNSPATSALIQGNFVGTDVTGTAAPLGNRNGICINAPGVIVGGNSPAQRNVVSGNVYTQVEIDATATVTGNFIGSNSAGTASIPNEDIVIGIYILENSPPNSVIGGTAAGAGNLIAGNGGGGVWILADDVHVQGNLIGTEADGVSPLPNSGGGIHIQGARNAVIGGTSSGAANVIANNGGDGVHVEKGSAATTGNTIRGNSIYANAGMGINNVNNGNLELAPPIIAQAGHGGAHGTSCAGCTVDIYSDDAGQGRIYQGSTTANATNWTFSGSLAGPNVTATSTDSGGNTSEFSAPVTIGLASPTPSPAPTNSGGPSATPTATASPTPTPTSTPGPTNSGGPTQTPTPTPTNTPTQTAATVTASPTPTGTPPPTPIQGDTDCNGSAGLDDFEFILEFAGGLNDGGTPPFCPDLTESVGGFPWGDVNCDHSVNALDALYVVAFEVGIRLHQPAGCVPIGSAIT